MMAAPRVSEPPESAETSEEKRIDTLESKVDRILGMLSGDGKPEPEAEPPVADPKAEMRQELARLKAAEDRKKARESEKAANESRLKAIEDKISEKPPVEHKRSTTFMRWRGDDER